MTPRQLASKRCVITGAARGSGWPSPFHALASDAAEFMTGSDIVIDGGMSL
jgi:hypothetical protein